MGGGGGSSVGAGAGGGTTSSRSDELTAGTRLKVRAIVGVDGARQQLGFFDTMRMENCSFGVATDGTQRCMPFENNANESGYFADSQCAQRLFSIRQECTTTPRYGLRVLVTTCPYAYELHSLGPRVSPAPTMLFAQSGTNCVATTPVAGYQFFPSTGAVAPSGFVQGNFVVEP